MANLIDDVPEAKAFCEEVKANIDKYKRFDGEAFAHLMDAVLSTTGIDSQGHAFTAEHLEDFANSFNAGVSWGGMHHDPRIHPIARGLAAKVFYSPTARLHFLVAVLGYYDTKSLPTFSDIGIDVTSLSEADTTELTRDPTGPYANLALNPHEVEISTFKAITSLAPGVVNSEIVGRFRKSVDLPSIVAVTAAYWILLRNEFSKAFLKRYGEVAADQSLKFFTWLIDHVAHAVAALVSPKIIMVIETEFSDCCLEFVIASGDYDAITKAIEVLPPAAARALSLVHALADLGPSRLVYEYDRKKMQWKPLYAATAKRGIIAEQPILVTIQELSQMGLSIGGQGRIAVHEEKEKAGPPDLNQQNA